MNHANRNRLADPETLLQCPYDNTHMVRVKRWQPHIIKCRRNHPTKDLRCCPFNARHELPAPEMPHHLNMCPDQVIVHGEILHGMEKLGMTPEGEVVKGCTDAPPVTDWARHCVNDEWAEEYRRRPVQVDVSSAKEVMSIDRSRFTPAQRREHRKLLKQLADAERDGEPVEHIRAAIKDLVSGHTTWGPDPPVRGQEGQGAVEAPPPAPTAPPRQPHGPPQVDLLAKRMAGVQRNGHIENGKSRLAANFNMSGAGVGRGMKSPKAPTDEQLVDKRVEMLARLAAGRGVGVSRPT